MLNWKIEKRLLELKYTWRISRNESDSKINLFVTVADGQYEGMGEAAPNVRYNESPELLEKQFEQFPRSSFPEPATPNVFAEQLKELPIANALRFAIESAYIDYYARKSATTINSILNIPEMQNIQTSYSIPIMDIGLIKKFYSENDLVRFQLIKVKVNQESAFETLKHLSTFIDQPLIVDANESWTDVEQLIYFLEKINKLRIEFIEQPLPSAFTDQSIYLKKYTPFKLFADESITDEADFTSLKKMFDGVNIKLMKAGGYFNGIRLLKEAKARNMQTMIGCMVETTIGISSGMHLVSLADYVDLDSFLVIKNEPFKKVSEKNGELIFN